MYQQDTGQIDHAKKVYETLSNLNGGRSVVVDFDDLMEETKMTESQLGRAMSRLCKTKTLRICRHHTVKKIVDGEEHDHTIYRVFVTGHFGRKPVPAVAA